MSSELGGAPRPDRRLSLPALPGQRGEQALLELSDAATRVTIGRRATNDLALPWDSQVSRVHAERGGAQTLTSAQRRVLVALCRPLDGPGYAAPASNQQIADELFGLEALPQNQKRAALAARGRALIDS